MIFFDTGGILVKKVIPIMLVAIFLLTSVAAAAANEWTDKRYDWGQVKTVVLFSIYVSKDVSDRYALQKTRDILIPELVKLKPRVVTLDAVVDQMSIDLNVNLAEMYKSDYKQFARVVTANLPRYADVALLVNVHQMGWTKQYVPPQSYSYTSHQNVDVYSNKSGHLGWMSVPVQNQVNIPGGMQDFPTASLELTLYDLKTVQPVWGYSDVYDKQWGGFLDSRKNTPEINATDLMKKAFDKIPLAKVEK